MTRSLTTADRFVDAMTDGFVAAHARLVRRGPGGVLRRHEAPAGEVAVVIGGGSGHYPAFAGLVGAGLAHAAAMGDVFASPSAQQVAALAAAADNGGGVLLTYGNYAGDVLNFDAAAERLRAEGIAVESVVVTDDVCSAPPERRHERRGIAGDLPVFLLAAAAAERGASLDEVARVARHANDRVRSFGVAFGGCTLPGAAAPLFTVPEGKMAVGLGIHGEPGVDLVDAPDAETLAALLVDGLIAEQPEGLDASPRAVVFVNGLGALKSEELFIVYGAVAARLAERGVEIVDPHVGEYCTSFDMAGLSLTLLWLDDELEALWQHPVDAPAYRRGAVIDRGGDALDDASGGAAVAAEITDADEASRIAAGTVVAALDAIRDVIDANADELGRIDAVAGDGDHGIGMQRGVRAAARAAAQAHEAGAGAGTTAIRAADAWSDRAGGTSGALWGAILTALGTALGDEGRPSATDVSDGVAAASDAVRAYGKADVGDKTMVDALVPFASTLAARVRDGAALTHAWADAARVAQQAAADTAQLLPRKGRARTHGEHAVGTPDAGAHSLALIVVAVSHVLDAPAHTAS